MQTADIHALQFSDYDSELYARALGTVAALVSEPKIWSSAAWGVRRDLFGQEIPPEQVVPFPFEQSQMLWGLNKSIHDPRVRGQIATEIATAERAHLGRSEPRAPSHETASRLARFSNEGVVELPPLLTGAEIVEVLDYVSTHHDMVFENSLRHYLVKDIVRAPHLLRAAVTPWLMELVEVYLGMPPTLVDISLWESLPEAPEPWGAQIFHRDRDDFRACKLFVYLNDIGPDQGPHIFVRGSHNPDQIKARLPAVDDSQIPPFFKYDGRQLTSTVEKLFGSAVTEFTGPAGTSFLENTYGFHRGKPPTSGSRLILQAMYACIPYAQRIARLTPGRLTHMPPRCEDTAGMRHLLRLLL